MRKCETCSDLEQIDEYVFHGTRGKRLKSVRKPVATTMKKAGVEKATFHDFRGSWASWMSEEGVDPYTIMEIGGWSSLMILERYLHRTRANRQSAIEKINGILNSQFIPENENVLELEPRKSALN